MITTLPYQWEIEQPRAEQPAASYSEFMRTLRADQGRPVVQPYNIAAGDSSGYSFSGGKLDHLPFFAYLDAEQDDAELLVLEPLFSLWFEEACLEYGWAVDRFPAPAHTWDWPAKPDIDPEKTANARATALGNGTTTLRAAYSEQGLDYEEELAAMAVDYGVTVDEMREILRRVVFAKADQAGPRPTTQTDTPGDPPAPRPSANGNGRYRQPARA